MIRITRWAHMENRLITPQLEELLPVGVPHQNACAEGLMLVLFIFTDLRRPGDDTLSGLIQPYLIKRWNVGPEQKSSSLDIPKADAAGARGQHSIAVRGELCLRDLIEIHSK